MISYDCGIEYKGVVQTVFDLYKLQNAKHGDCYRVSDIPRLVLRFKDSWITVSLEINGNISVLGDVQPQETDWRDDYYKWKSENNQEYKNEKKNYIRRFTLINKRASAKIKGLVESKYRRLVLQS